MNKAVSLMMLAGAMGYVPKPLYQTKKEIQSQEQKELLLKKAEEKRIRKQENKKTRKKEH